MLQGESYQDVSIAFFFIIIFILCAGIPYQIYQYNDILKPSFKIIQKNVCTTEFNKHILVKADDN